MALEPGKIYVLPEVVRSRDHEVVGFRWPLSSSLESLGVKEARYVRHAEHGHWFVGKDSMGRNVGFTVDSTEGFRPVPKRVFIAHPMSGDIEGNKRKVVEICRRIHSLEVLPVFPSFTTRQYLTDDPEDRELARIQIEEYFRRGMVDELWLFGDAITKGMIREIHLARRYNIPVVEKTHKTMVLLGDLDFLEAIG